GKQMRVTFLQEALAKSNSDSSFSPVSLASPDQTASFYMRREEQSELLRQVLAEALDGLLDRLRKAENFRDLQIVEMIFYAPLRNKDVARWVNMDEKAIALTKHRSLKEIKSHVAQSSKLSRDEIMAVDSPAWE